LPGAAAQQGLIQMVRDFCDHSNAICDHCKLPELVRDFTGNQTMAGDAFAVITEQKVWNQGSRERPRESV
jgi:hypothetical protein